MNTSESIPCTVRIFKLISRLAFGTTLLHNADTLIGMASPSFLPFPFALQMLLYRPSLII